MPDLTKGPVTNTLFTTPDKVAACTAVIWSAKLPVFDCKLVICPWIVVIWPVCVLCPDVSVFMVVCCAAALLVKVPKFAVIDIKLVSTIPPTKVLIVAPDITDSKFDEVPTDTTGNK